MHLSKISLALRQWGAAGFSPRSLFASGEQGAWYDPSDLSTMFQDSAGTTPVTADGQPVGKILDKSGRGNHASQATAASRPLYRTDGTYHWLQFDGVDDQLSSSTFSSNIVDGVTNVLGISMPSFVNYRVSYDGSGNDSMQLFNNGTSGAQRLWAGGIGSISFSTLVSGSKYVLTNVFNLTNGFARTNQVQIATTTGAVDTTSIRIGGKASNYNALNLFSFINRVQQLSTTEITQTEAWVNGKTGAY